jgi:hypothetical protein
MLGGKGWIYLKESKYHEILTKAFGPRGRLTAMHIDKIRNPELMLYML